MLKFNVKCAKQVVGLHNVLSAPVSVQSVFSPTIVTLVNECESSIYQNCIIFIIQKLRTTTFVPWAWLMAEFYNIAYAQLIIAVRINILNIPYTLNKMNVKLPLPKHTKSCTALLC